MRSELLNEVTTFSSLHHAQEAISTWVRTYNETRPHQLLEMASPATRFRPNPPQPLTVNTSDWQPQPATMPEPDDDPVPTVIDEAAGRPSAAPIAIEWEATVRPRGIITTSNRGINSARGEFTAEDDPNRPMPLEWATSS
nr:integrase core domain-containing protein [Nocardia miyunensis]